MTWQEIRLGDVADMLVGFAFKSQHFLDAKDEGVRILRGDNVQQGYIRWGEKTKKWRSDAFDDLSRYQLQDGDVILAMDRPIVGDGLKLAWVTEDDLPCLLVQRVTRIRGAEGKAVTAFLRYAIASIAFKAHIDRITTGANIPHISGKDIASYTFHLPPIDEQERIASAISTYDDLIETNRRRIALLEESARLLYREWFVKLRFPGHEQVKKVDGVPEGWTKQPLKEMAFLNYGKALKGSERKDGEVPVYGSSGIVGAHNLSLIPGPTIIVGRKGNVGSIYFSRDACWPIDTVYYVSDQQTSYYLYLLLQTMNFISSDAAVPGLNREYAHGLPVISPPPDLLKRFEETVDPLFRQVEALQKMNKQSVQARDALLPKLMSGQLTL